MVGSEVNGAPRGRDFPGLGGHVLYERPAGTDFVREWLDATETGGQRSGSPPGTGARPAGTGVGPTGPTAVNLLCVSASVTVDEWIALVSCLDGVGAAGMVSIGDGVRSTAANSTAAGSASGPTTAGSPTTAPSTGATNAGGRLAFTTVGDAGDLASVGLAVEAFVDDWRGNGARTVVCLDALPAFLERREEVRVLRFVAALLAQLEYDGVAAHAVLVPDAVDGWTRSALASLFETVDRGAHGDA